ncbi:replication protein [Limnobaculum xujianqingii]|uniref:replication protein n=1 Tax=Limnobaculum xujianqingii TaxID=2738837 RepID=UPI0011285D47|nr:replication protein [Limnobaculum xujianqingii]
MGNVAYDNVTPIRPDLQVVERRVADTDDGYTKLANELYEELIGANLTRNQAKVAHAICRKTYGYNKKMDRIADSQLAQLTKLPRQKVNTAKNQLIAMRVIIRDGNMIGPNKNLSEWDLPECHQFSDSDTKTVTKSVTKTVIGLSPKQGHTKDNIQKKERKDPPNPHSGVSDSQAKNPTKKKSEPIPYQAVMDAYNEAVGDRLPNADTLNDKRKRAIKKLFSELAHPTVSAAKSYFSAFIEDARPFYFGDNDRGWKANFDYLLRSDTLLKVREGSL